MVLLYLQVCFERFQDTVIKKWEKMAVFAPPVFALVKSAYDVALRYIIHYHGYVALRKNDIRINVFCSCFLPSWHGYHTEAEKYGILKVSTNWFF